MPPSAAPVAPAAPIAPDRPFAPPRVAVGQIVLWTYGPDSGEVPCPAIVRKVGTLSLNLSMVIEGGTTLRNQTGCRHADDPFLRSMPEHSAGCWRLTPRDVQIDALLAANFGHSEEE